jgi:hypothetical protein
VVRVLEASRPREARRASAWLQQTRTVDISAEAPLGKVRSGTRKSGRCRLIGRWSRQRCGVECALRLIARPFSSRIQNRSRIAFSGQCRENFSCLTCLTWNFIDHFNRTESQWTRALRDGVIPLEGLSPRLQNHLNDGVHDSQGDHKTPRDGLVFLHALRFEFSGSYLRASEVKD